MENPSCEENKSYEPTCFAEAKRRLDDLFSDFKWYGEWKQKDLLILSAIIDTLDNILIRQANLEAKTTNVIHYINEPVVYG